MSFSIWEFKLKEAWVNEQVKKAFANRQESLEFELRNGEWKGYFSLMKNDVRYEASFELLEVLLYGDGEKEWALILMDAIPKVEAQGNLLHSVGTSIANYLSQFMSLEAVQGLLEGHIPGLKMRENDMILDLGLRAQPDFGQRAFAFLLRNGLQIRLFPKEDELCVKIEYQRVQSGISS